MSKLQPVPDQFAVGQTAIAVSLVDGDTCECGYPFWMHDRERVYDDHGPVGGYYYRYLCPGKEAMA